MSKDVQVQGRPILPTYLSGVCFQSVDGGVSYSEELDEEAKLAIDSDESDQYFNCASQACQLKYVSRSLDRNKPLSKQRK